MSLKAIPILPAIDLSETNTFYRNKLKFVTRYYGNYLIVHKGDVEIHFFQWEDIRNFIPGGCYIVDSNVEDLYSKFCSMDMIAPAGNLVTNARGKKEFCVLDNNGNELKFCEP